MTGPAMLLAIKRELFTVLLVAIISMSVWPTTLLAQRSASAEDAFLAAIDLLKGQPVETADLARLQALRAALDQLVTDFPASDLAVHILLGETIDGLDLSALDTRLTSAEAMAKSDSGAPAEVGLIGTGGETYGIPIGDVEALTALPDGATISGHVSGDLALLSPISPILRGLEQALTRCYGYGTGKDRAQSGNIRFAIGQDGLLSGSAVPANGGAGVAAEQEISLVAIQSIADCGPFPPEYAGQAYLATFTDRTLIGLAHLPEGETPWVTADEQTEAELDLDRRTIAEIQGRLTLLGFNPNGIDGSLGRGARAAISEWQESHFMPATGYLDGIQLAALRDLSQDAFQDWLINSGGQEIIDRAAVPPAKKRRKDTKGWYKKNGLYCKATLVGTWCQSNVPKALRP